MVMRSGPMTKCSLARRPASSRKGLALYHRGITYERAHDWPHAETDLLAALMLRPDDPGLLNYLAFSWADQGINLDRARTMLERAIQLVPDDGAIIDSLGWVMFRQGDYEDAAKQLEHAVELEADDATVNDHLGDAYWRLGRQIEARSQWERAARLTADKALGDQLREKLKDGLDSAPAAPRLGGLIFYVERVDRMAAPAKLDLYLHVTGKRPDGYHLLDGLVALPKFTTHSPSRRPDRSNFAPTARLPRRWAIMVRISWFAPRARWRSSPGAIPTSGSA